MKFLIGYLKEKRNIPTIIFSTRSETFLEPLLKKLKKTKLDVEIITGRINLKEREEAIRKFQEGYTNLILCNIQSAGIGISLSRAETAIFADRSYSPSENEQAEARFLPVKPSEESRVKMVIDLICKNTIDEKIIKILKRKQDVTKILNENPKYFFS
jgi:SNF2 family DNA or RNA helicase